MVSHTGKNMQFSLSAYSNSAPTVSQWKTKDLETFILLEVLDILWNAFSIFIFRPMIRGRTTTKLVAMKWQREKKIEAISQMCTVYGVQCSEQHTQNKSANTRTDRLECT